MCAELPFRHSFHPSLEGQFRGPEARSCPLPAAVGLSQFGAVSDCADQQALDRPFAVELFAAARLKRSPDPVTTRSHLSPSANSLRWHTLNEPDGTFTRIALRLWSEPRGGICAPWHSPALRIAASPRA